MAQSTPPYRFAVESTLGRLAKWLRLLGFDTRYHPHQHSRNFCAEAPGARIGLARSKRGLKEHGYLQLIFIKSDRVQDQLCEVIQTLGLTMSDMRPFTRCLQCNTVILKIDKRRIRGKVPDYIWQNHHLFHTCQRCGRVYWAGSHTRRGRDLLQRIFDQTC